MKERTQRLKEKLEATAIEINSGLGIQVKIFQQRQTKGNMGFEFEKRDKLKRGRLYVGILESGYFVSPQGKQLEEKISKVFEKLFGKPPDGYRQTKPEPHAPHWVTEDFQLVKKAAYLYAILAPT